MHFIKVRDVKSPVRDVNENAGIDFYIPENTEEFRAAFLAKNPAVSIDEPVLTYGPYTKPEDIKSYLTVDGKIYIAPHKDVLIPSGIKSKFESNLALIANNKSGVATKKKLVFGASVIDASYHGEWHLHLINTSDSYQTVECGTKVIQFIPHYISMDPVEIFEGTEEEFYSGTTSKRGAGWAGSTGIN